MQLNKNQVTEINLKDLFFHILYRWRSILIAALIGALVLCGYQWWSVKTTHDAGKLTKEERQYQIDLQQYKEDLASNRNTINVYSKLIQEQNDYLDNSIYIQLSPQSLWAASSKYLVRMSQAETESSSQASAIDQVDSILPLYAAPLSRVTDSEQLKKAFGTEKIEYVNELVIVSTNVEDNTVTLFVLGESKEAAEAGLELLDEQMEAITEDKTNDITPHQLILVSKSTTRGLDSVIRGVDKDMSTRIDLSAKQETLAKTTEENQKTLQAARKKLDSLEASGEPEAPGLHLVKMAIIGFILGAAFLAFIYAMNYILKGSLNNAKDLTSRYGLPVFGELPTSGQLHSNKGLDKLISKWELGNNATNNDPVFNSIAALIAEKKETKTVLLVSTLAMEKLLETKEALEKRLLDKTISIQAEATHNSDAITEAGEADAVIITEAKGISKLKSIDRMAETLIIAEANVIGAIIL